MQIILEQIAMLGLLALIGAGALLTKLLKDETMNGIVKLITKLTLPLLIFSTFAGSKITGEILRNSSIIIVVSMLSIVLFFLFSTITARLLHLNKENTALHRASTMFGNVVFLGFPVINAIFPGGEGLIYATMYQLGQNALIWTWGVFILNKGSDKTAKENWRHLINPVTIAFAAGLIFMVLPFDIPKLIMKPVSDIGHTTTYISMIYVGAVLAKANPLKVFINVRSYLVSLNKLIIIPLIIVFVFKYTGLTELFAVSKAAMGVMVLLSGMPCMILISVLAKDLGLDDRQSVENIFLSTVLSFGTLSLLFWLL